MKLLNAAQIRELDRLSIKEQKIASSELMERAANIYFKEMMSQFGGIYEKVLVFAGSGNNGGDAVAIARLCQLYFQKVQLYILKIGDFSSDLLKMIDTLPKDIIPQIINNGDKIQLESDPETMIIDGIFGSGLSRPVTGFWASIIDKINHTKSFTCSIDIPSGLASDTFDASGAIINANWTLSFEMPKLSFFLPESQGYLGNWTFQSIGLSQYQHENMNSNIEYIDHQWIADHFIPRKRNDHKGSLGHGALITGSYGMAGAAYLSAMGAMRSGIGKLSCYVPEVVQEMIQLQVPEAICTGNNGYQCIESVHLGYHHDAIGIGCGIGMNNVTVKWMDEFLDQQKGVPLIIDADGLNIIAQQSWQKRIPKGSIISPHPGEFKRLFGSFESYEEAFKVQDEMAKQLGIGIILKLPNTRIATPDGKVYFNSTGNPGMATAGSGDVLTGIITGLKAQGYPIYEAAIIGVYLHGSAGDLAAEAKGRHGMIARDIIEYLPYAIKKIEISK